MILRHLEFLTELACERHFAHAAASCKVTQSTLSAGIKQMEESSVFWWWNEASASSA
jgi:DNA-binding transcriptional LysR family regulator